MVFAVLLQTTNILPTIVYPMEIQWPDMELDHKCFTTNSSVFPHSQRFSPFKDFQ